VFLDHGTTGDGMVAALQVLTIMRRTNSPVSRLAAVMTRFPQVLKSIVVARKEPIDRVPALEKVIRQVEHELGADGRVLVRYSGTEPKMRVMLEGLDGARLAEYLDRIVEVVQVELGAAA
jgi:phosphoglucosamine mutase